MQSGCDRVAGHLVAACDFVIRERARTQQLAQMGGRCSNGGCCRPVTWRTTPNGGIGSP